MENNILSKLENETILSLKRRANAIIADWDVVPIFPTVIGNFEYVASARFFDPLYRLSLLRAEILKTFMEHTNYMYDENAFDELLDATYGISEKALMKRILDSLVENFKKDFKTFRYKYTMSVKLYEEEGIIYHYVYSIYKISKILNNGDGLFFALQVLKALEMFCCEKTEKYFSGVPRTGMLLSIKEFKKDQELYYETRRLIENEIELLSNKELSEKLREMKQNEKSDIKKSKSKKTLGIIIRTLLVVFANSFLGLYTKILMSFDVELYPKFDLWAIDVSVIIDILMILMFNIKHKNLLAVIAFDIFMIALFYPICHLVSYYIRFCLINQ